MGEAFERGPRRRGRTSCAIGRRAYAYSRRMVWSAVRRVSTAPRTGRVGHPRGPSLAGSLTAINAWPAPLYPWSADHLDALTDDVGIMQHAIGPARSGPRLLHGRRRPSAAGRSPSPARAWLGCGRAERRARVSASWTTRSIARPAGSGTSDGSTGRGSRGRLRGQSGPGDARARLGDRVGSRAVP